MKRLLLLFALSLPILAKAQTTAALPLPTDMHYVYLDMFGQSCNYGINLVESDIGSNGLPGVTYYAEDAVAPMYCSNIVYCPMEANPGIVYSQVGNKWFKGLSLWFDWDNQVGDTCQVLCGGNWECVVSSIDTLIFADLIPRRQYHLIYTGSGEELFLDNHPFTFIEGIGTNNLGLESQEIETNQFLSCVYDKNGLQLIQNEWFSYVGCCNSNSVNELPSNSFKLFPSPATDQTSIQFEAAHIPQSIQIFNATGQLMHTEKVLGRLQMQVNVSEYAKGIYTVRGRFENGEEVSERLVVE
jgi:hypothetical protein